MLLEPNNQFLAIGFVFVADARENGFAFAGGEDEFIISVVAFADDECSQNKTARLSAKTTDIP